MQFVAAISQGFRTSLKLDAILLRQKLHRVAATKIACVNGPLESVEEFGTNHGPHATSVPSGAAGRPKSNIPQEQLQYLIDHEISMTKIAQALGVSKSTIKRRVREYGISVGPRIVLDDSELDTLVRDIQREFPNAGYRRIHSQLKSRGVKVTQSRVRESMQRTDPEGVAMRWLNITPRAVYSVRGPLSLWHIDGNHKLISNVLLLSLLGLKLNSESILLYTAAILKKKL